MSTEPVSSLRDAGPAASAPASAQVLEAQSAVTLKGVSKRFGQVLALDDLALTVMRGEVHGLIGPNGAGKTTALRVIMGFIRSDAGRCSVLGQDPWDDATALHRRLAFVPGDVALWPALTGGETIDLLTGLRGGVDPVRRDELIDRLKLDPKKRVRSYSKGNRQKVALIAALACRAELLVVDEPTTGLDPWMERVFRDLIAEERDDGRTVLLSTHRLDEVEATCDRVTLIDQGARRRYGEVRQLRGGRATAVRAEVDAPPPLQDIAGVSELRIDGASLTCRVEERGLSEVLGRLAAAGVRHVTCRDATLEDAVLKTISR